MGGNTLSSAGRSFVALLCRIKAFKKLISDRQTQVFFTLIITTFLSCIQWYSSDKVVVKELELYLPHFSTASKTLHIAMLSDLHGGAMVYQEQIAKVVDVVNGIESNFGVELDAVLIVGDLIDAPRELIEERMEPLRHLRSRLGTFAVSGNHEYYYGNYERWQQLYREYGINVMENDIFKIDDSVCLIGLQDLSAYKSGIKNTAMNVTVINQCPSNYSTVIMAHNPAATKKIITFSNEYHRDIDLILSGHTHGGQYYILIPYVYWFLPYLYGLYSVNNGLTKLFVSAGTLYQASPMKMWGKSEIWLLTLSGFES
uniref:Calcineurin-like phosphoesterase domain-containing protein n=1 Tax=Panagrolaimus superbus TaxID=310955 RepID=A0A914YBJ7_9BILA